MIKFIKRALTAILSVKEKSIGQFLGSFSVSSRMKPSINMSRAAGFERVKRGKSKSFFTSQYLVPGGSQVEYKLFKQHKLILGFS